MTDEKDIEQEVKIFLKILERDFDLTAEDLRWISNYHRTLAKYGNFIAQAVAVSAVLALLSGLGYAFIEGLKHIVAGLK